VNVVEIDYNIVTAVKYFLYPLDLTTSLVRFLACRSLLLVCSNFLGCISSSGFLNCSNSSSLLAQTASHAANMVIGWWVIFVVTRRV
jgi:hypothetical protein